MMKANRMMSNYHLPVMPNEVLDALAIKPDGIYVDGTLGGGGHSALILQRLSMGRLIGIDRDKDALKAASERIGDDPRFTSIHGNFHDLPKIFDKLEVGKVDGVLLDLGVSSFQLDTAERGFSYRFDALPDMRMDRESELTACTIINTYTEKELADIIFNYGEECFSRRIARAITEAVKPINSTLELSKIIASAVPKRGNTNPAMRTFMALRIAVNNELDPLASVIASIIPRISLGGRLVVITFHSLEDRIIKNAFKTLTAPCTCPRDLPYCVCEKKPSVKILTKKAITPTKEEIEANSRSHSAKLRIVEIIV